MHRLLLCFALFLSVTGCVSVNAKGEQFSEASIAKTPGQATIVLFRAPLQVGSALWPVVTINGTLAVELYNAGYTVITTAPGSYEIVGQMNGSGKTTQPEAKMAYTTHLEAQPDKVYFVEFRINEAPNDATLNGAPVHYFKPPIESIEWRAWPEGRTPLFLQMCRYVQPKQSRFSGGP